ncbi:MAG: hypothetical protein ACYDCC_07740 [Actinomycetota bacterium]
MNDILTSLWSTAIGGTKDVREIIRRFNNTMTQRDWPDLHGDIRAGYLWVLRTISCGAKEMKTRHAKLMEGIVQLLSDGVAEGQQNGSLRKDIDPRDTAMLLLLSAIASIVWDDIDIELGMPKLGESLINLLAAPPAETSSNSEET